MKLELHYPVRPALVNQYFGKKDQKYTVLNMTGHNGIDFRAKHGQPVYASHDGFASFQIDDHGGHGVVVITDKDYEGQFYKTLYWHLVDGLKEPIFKSPIQDKTGFTKVKQGEIIGYADNTGYSTGSHLHFGLKPVAKGEDWGTWYNTAQSNGYNGAIDPLPFMKEIVDTNVDDISVLKAQRFELLKKALSLAMQLYQKLTGKPFR